MKKKINKKWSYDTWPIVVPVGSKIKAKKHKSDISLSSFSQGLQPNTWYTVAHCDEWGNITMHELIKGNSTPWTTISEFDLDSVITPEMFDELVKNGFSQNKATKRKKKTK